MKYRKAVGVIGICLTLSLLSTGALAQRVEPTPEQLKLLEQLPADQRQKLIEQYGREQQNGQETDEVVFPELVLAPETDDGAQAEPIVDETAESRLFGRELFVGVPTTFAPATDVPVPPDYVLGPGDTVQVQFYGKENATYNFEISRDGILNLPELGPISVVGLSFTEFREDIQKRVANTLIGTNVAVSMGQLRSVRVFVLGDVNRPGSYVVSGLSTMTHALFVSGGISQVGSLRNIQLKRRGVVVESLDLYDLLLNGDTSHDAQLMQGDVLFVPTIGDTVDVAGEVRRPAIYELKGESSIRNVLDLAGGMNAEAYEEGATLERIATDNRRVMVQVDLSTSAGLEFVVVDGDRLEIPKVLDEVYKQVILNGHVYRPGAYAWSEGMRLTDLIRSASDLLQQAELRYVLIRRELPATGEIEVISANLEAAWSDPSGNANIALKSRDQVFVFDLSDSRQEVTEGLLSELRLQSRTGEFNAQISVSGQVRAPGTYPLEPGMKISDALRAAGDLTEKAYAIAAELVRFEITDGALRQAQVLNVDIKSILSGSSSASDFSLQPYDKLNIKVIPEWGDEWIVVLEGEFNFPGQYTLRRGETLESVLARAGGITPQAFPTGAIFLREELKERERQAIREASEKLRSDLAALALEGAASGEKGGAETVMMGNSLLEQLETAEVTGRLVVPFANLVNGTDTTGFAGLEMQNGDRILMPGKKFEITVIGEVQQPTSHLFNSTFSRDDYIAKSGGLTKKADGKKIYIVRASGEVVGLQKSRWLGRSGNMSLEPGDTIVVPLDADRMRPMAFWSGVTQILYQGAISVAAVKTFNR